MANHFGARVAISRFQRLKTHRRSHPGRCPGLLHFAPLALGIQVLTQPLNRWAIFNRPLTRTRRCYSFCIPAQRWLARTSRASTVLSLPLSVADKNVSTHYEQPTWFHHPRIFRFVLSQYLSPLLARSKICRNLRPTGTEIVVCKFEVA